MTATTEPAPARAPLVSVVLPTFNRQRVLGRAITSVLGQTYRNLELIVVDDGSTDGTGELVGTMADPRVRLVRKGRREGAAKARNDGIRAAAGELIAFQDSDDEWLSTKLERQVALLENSSADVGWIGGSHLAMLPAGPIVVSAESLVHGVDYQHDLLDGRAFVTPTWLVRRALLLEVGLFDEALGCLEDWDLILRLDRVCRFRAVAEPVVRKHGSADSLFGDVPRRIAALEAILLRHQERWQRSPRMYAHYYGELGRLYGLQGHRHDSVRDVRVSLRLDRRRPRTYVLLAAALAGQRWCRRVQWVVPTPAHRRQAWASTHGRPGQ
jgi:glycosyltransferase involved in cell wall biosynthesis